MKIPQDIIIQPDNSGNWILYNVFTLNTIAVTNNTLELLSLISSGKKLEEIKKKYSKKKFKVWEIGRFPNTDGLLSDPTGRIRDEKEWPRPRILNLSDIIEFLKMNNFLIYDNSKYLNLFNPKKSLLDKEHLGTFHQQLGQALLIDKRVDPSEWWIKQKFLPDLNGLNDTLYKAIQEHFLKAFFENRFNSSHSVIDLGCGIGYYTKLMGITGAKVLGIDPNEKYINIAKKNSPENVSFKTSEIGTKNALNWIGSNSVDFVFMSDALLFYFVSPDPKQNPDINFLFSSIRRILKPGGRFLSMEPHGTFFLRPWLGEKERPFTILTEHKTKRFNITPTYKEITKSFIDGGFVIRDIREIDIDESFAKKDFRATYFAKEFPLWWFFELEPQK